MNEHGKMAVWSLFEEAHQITEMRLFVGGNKRHAMLTFANEEHVNEVMSNRDHLIDGKHVIFHRSVPNPGPLRDTYGSPYLFVSTVGGQPMSQAVVEDYFSDYGGIPDICPKDNERDAWILTFD